MAQDLTYEQVWLVARLYERREALFELHRWSVSNSDINGFLTYKPWLSQGRLDNYRGAINKGELKQLNRAYAIPLYVSFFPREQIDQLDYLTEEHKQRIERFRNSYKGEQQ